MKIHPFAGVLVATVILPACGSGDEPAKTQTQDQAPSAPAPEKTMLEQARDHAKGAMDKAADLAGSAVEKGRAAAETAVARGKEYAEEAKPRLDAARETVAEKAHEAAGLAREKGAAAAQSASDMADAAVEKAKELIAQAQDYINQNKPELARQAVNKLNVLKDVMPQAIQVQIDKLNALIGGESASAPAAAPVVAPGTATVAPR